MLEYYCSVIVVLEYGVYSSMPTHTLASIHKSQWYSILWKNEPQASKQSKIALARHFPDPS